MEREKKKGCHTHKRVFDVVHIEKFHYMIQAMCYVHMTYCHAFDAIENGNNASKKVILRV